MATIGHKSAPATKAHTLERARHRASLVPDLLVDARRIANTVMAGWHGRRRRGIGESFWQYRPYQPGETLARIDWRRSARDDHTYVRDLEWEAAHTVWIWVDLSPSMLFRSNGARTSKEERALIIAIAMADLLSSAGERIGYPGLLRPRSSRSGAERLATALIGSDVEQAPDWPDLSMVRRYSEMLVISDFLRPMDECSTFLDEIGRHGARPHLVEIADPAEEDFPYRGRTEFLDPESGQRITSGRAQDWVEEYRTLRRARRATLRQRTQSLAGSYTVSRTDQLASETLVRLHGMLTGNPEEVASLAAPEVSA
ncbi:MULTISPECIES: DUF58 domain-containing protein [unclassified Roseitalea]|uniref:DUF58 domain-containing protein n=1 Tax=unclassified Roseitalea TaxID=2639107 RepID=UPI0027402C21|nr:MULTISPECIES: DUF58 domain-containing protein [unclassified Roseitalea]